MYFSTGRFPFELAQRSSRVALASHIARSSTPLGVTKTVLDAEDGNAWLCIFVRIAQLSAQPAAHSRDAANDSPTCGTCPIKHEPAYRTRIGCARLSDSNYHSVHFITHQSFAFY